MKPLLRNYRHARKVPALRELARRYLVSGLKARAVMSVYLLVFSPLLLVSSLAGLLGTLERLIDKAIDALARQRVPGRATVEAYDRLHEELYHAYAKHRRGTHG